MNKLHLGCGKRYMAGWVNIDGAITEGAPNKPDKIMDLSQPLPFDDKSVAEILAVHLFEHFYPQDAELILSDWFRVLMPGGRLVMEMPDIYKSAKNLIKEIDSGQQPSNKWSLWPLYGDNPNQTHYDCHKTGWTFRTLAPILTRIGFVQVAEKDPQYHGRKVNRDFRIEAIKL